MQYQAAVFGEAIIDLIAQQPDQYSAYIGGSPFNVARSFAKQGIESCYLSPISTDHYGQKIYEFAQEQSIGLPLANRSGCPSSLALVYLDENKQPDYCLYRKGIADLDITTEKLRALIPKNIKLFHTGSLALVPDMVEVLSPLLEELKSQGVAISMDINMRKGVEQDNALYIKAVKDLVSYADIVKVSDEDLTLLGYECSPQDGAKALLQNLNQAVVVLTKGAEGSEIFAEEFHLQQDAYPPQQFGDTVGAGDTFFSAFLSQLIRDNSLTTNWQKSSLSKALNIGLMAATLNVERNGCHPPSLEEVSTRLSSIDQSA